MAQVDYSLHLLWGFAAAAAAAVLGVRSPGTESVGEKREGGVFVASERIGTVWKNGGER